MMGDDGAGPLLAEKCAAAPQGNWEVIDGGSAPENDIVAGDDGAGPLLAEKCAAAPKGNWVVIDGGSAPENDIVAIRERRPTRLLFVDATDLGLNPG